MSIKDNLLKGLERLARENPAGENERLIVEELKTPIERPLPSACTRGHRLAWHADGRGFDVLQGEWVLTVVKYPRRFDWRKVTFCPWCGAGVMVEQ